MHKTHIAYLTLALLVVAVTTPVGAGQIRYLPDAPGVWKPWTFRAYDTNRSRLAARPADVKALEAQLLALNAILKKTPGFASPVGFSVETTGELDLESFRPGQPALGTLPLPATFNFGAYGVHEFERNGKTVREDGGETAQLLLFVNQLALPLFFDDADTFLPEFQDLETDVTLLAASRPDFLGMPRYGNTLVLKKNPAPLWSAVSLEETLGLVTRAIEFRLTKSREVATRLQNQYDELTSAAKRAQRIAEYKSLAALSKDPGYMDKMMKAEQQMGAGAATLLGPIGEAGKAVAAIDLELAAAKAALAGLTPADRGAASCYESRDATSLKRFRSHPGGSCVAIVRPNWKLFNPALPRSAPQILVIAHFDGCFAAEYRSLHAGGCTANKKLLETMDQAAILAWLQ